MKINEIDRSRSIARALDAATESARLGVGIDADAYRRVFPLAAASTSICDVPGCEACREIDRVKEVPK